MTDYLRLLGKIDLFADGVKSRHPDDLRCRPGCADCCVGGIRVWPVEFDCIRRYIQEHPLCCPASKPEAGSESRCAFLDSGMRCSIYPARPVVCRLWGLPQRIDGSLSCCEKNFSGDVGLLDLSASDIVNLDTILKTLAAINHVYCKDLHLDPEERLSIEDAAF